MPEHTVGNAASEAIAQYVTDCRIRCQRIHTGQIVPVRPRLTTDDIDGIAIDQSEYMAWRDGTGFSPFGVPYIYAEPDMIPQNFDPIRHAYVWQLIDQRRAVPFNRHLMVFADSTSQEPAQIQDPEPMPEASNDADTNDESEDLVTCDNCGDEFPPDETVSEDGETYCESCHSDLYASCDRCGDPILRDDAQTPDHGRYEGDCLCGTCFESHCDRCQSCHETYDQGDIYTRGGVLYCSDCCPGDPDEDEDDDEDERTGHPHYSLHPTFTGFRRGIDKSETPTAYGIEIETETEAGRNGLCRAFIDAVNSAVRSHLNRTDLVPGKSFVSVGPDGSLTGKRGAEFGFLPLRIETLRHVFGDIDVRNAYSDLCDTYAMSPVNCRRIGLHISVSERIFSPAAKYRLAQIFAALDKGYSSNGRDGSERYIDDPKRWSPIRRLAVRLIGRRPSDYGNNYGSPAKAKAKQQHADKTHAVAIRAIARYPEYNPLDRAGSEGRIELRAFASSPHPGVLLDRIETANDMIIWALTDQAFKSDDSALYSFLRFHARRKRRRDNLHIAKLGMKPARSKVRLTKRQRLAKAMPGLLAASLDSASL